MFLWHFLKGNVGALERSTVRTVYLKAQNNLNPLSRAQDLQRQVTRLEHSDDEQCWQRVR